MEGDVEFHFQKMRKYSTKSAKFKREQRCYSTAEPALMDGRGSRRHYNIPPFINISSHSSFLIHTNTDLNAMYSSENKQILSSIIDFPFW